MALVFTLLCQHANERLHIMIDNDVDAASVCEISHLGERQVLPEKLDKMPGVLRLSTCTEHLRNERVGSGAALWESFLPYGDELRRERESESASVSAFVDGLEEHQTSISSKSSTLSLKSTLSTTSLPVSIVAMPSSKDAAAPPPLSTPRIPASWLLRTAPASPNATKKQALKTTRITAFQAESPPRLPILGRMML